MTLLDAQHLRKRYGATLAVDDVSFALERGEILGLLGPNGAGKTTTMMMITGLLAPDAGAVVIDGKPLDGAGTAIRHALGFVPQEVAVAVTVMAVTGRRAVLPARRLRPRSGPPATLRARPRSRHGRAATKERGPASC